MAKRIDAPHSPVADISVGSFDEDLSYRTRRSKGAEDWLIILTVGGRGRLRSPTHDRRTEVGDLVVIEPRAHQDYGTASKPGRWRMSWAHFQPRPTWLTLLDWPAWWPGVRGVSLTGQLFDQVSGAFDDAVRFYRLPLPHHRALAVNALERALLLADQANPQAERRHIDERIRRAMDFLCDALTEKVTLDDVAAAASLSPSRLSHLFAEQVGLTPMRFLEAQRLDRARQLLEHTGQPVQQIAERVGFDSPFYFSLRFKKHTGQSPRDYRNARR